MTTSAMQLPSHVGIKINKNATMFLAAFAVVLLVAAVAMVAYNAGANKANGNANASIGQQIDKNDPSIPAHHSWHGQLHPPAPLPLSVHTAPAAPPHNKL